MIGGTMISARRWTLALGTSVAALATASAFPAWAQCIPSPAVADSITTCSGTETNGLVVAVDKAQIVVDAGAVVSGPGRGGIMVMPPAGTDSYEAATSTIIVRGTVSGTAAGIMVASSQPGSPDYSYGLRTQSAIVVEQGGAIQGDVGVEVNPIGEYSSGWAWVTIDNSGTISGTSGIALRGNDSASGRFDWIRNRATGVIGAISGQVGSLNNEGLIDGGADSAISDLPAAYSYYGQGTIANGGTIRSSGAAATILQYRNFNPGNYVENTGTIENLGSGAAIAGNTIFYLDNGATGIIRSASSAAITAPAYLSINNAGRIESAGNAIETGGRILLTNSGTITGNVVSTTSNPYSGSIIDNRAGVIDGDLLLGDGNDVFIADSAGIGTITGRLDAGGGVDTLRYLFDADTTLNAGTALPASFEQIALWVGRSSTLTLGSAFTSNNTIAVGGGDPSFYNPEDRFTNQGLIDTDGQALVSDNNASGGLTVRNEGDIRARLDNPGQFAVDLGNEAYFSNAGTITATGGNAVRFTRGYELANSGSIIADGTAVSTTIALANSGTIKSTNGVGADLSNAYQGRSSNSGLIEGHSIGARLYYSTLVNSGTITSDGAALEFGYGAILYNEAGGVVQGGTAAVRQSSLYPGSGGSLISNAGLIQGNVDFGSGYAGTMSGNVFIARAGGILNGNLNLGSGNDTLVTSFVNEGPGLFSGISGVVTGNGSENLRYVIDGTIATNVGKVGIFSRKGYDLAPGSTLNLTGSATAADTLVFAGQGSVDLTADMNGGLSDPLIRMNVASYLTDAEGQTLANAITLVSHGTLSKTIADPYAFGAPLIALGTGNSFENAGTVRATGGQYYRLTAVAGGGTLINSGVIEVSHADAFSGGVYSSYDYAKVINGGIIREAANGDGTSRGVVNANVLINNGTIDMGGAAVVYNYLVSGADLTNNGLIRSANGAAITGSYNLVSIRNEADGVIQGGGIGAAIALGNGQIRNAGTIKGDVQFGVDYYGASGLYIADGGTIEGDLRFGSGNDMFLQISDDLGVTGTIDGGAGQDMFGRVFTQDATVMLGGRPDIGFERDYLLAQAGATISINASATSADTLFVGGEGTIVNLAMLDGTVSTGIPYYSSEAFAAYLPRKLASFVNRGTVNGGFAGTTTSFENQGSIGIGGATSMAAVSQYGYQGDLNFANSGTITGSAFGAVNLFGEGISAVNLRNDGRIVGHMTVNAAFANDVAGSIEITNSGLVDGNMNIVATFAGENSGNVVANNNGTIRADTGNAFAIINDRYTGISSGNYSLNNSGLIEADGGASAAVGLWLNRYNTSDAAHIANSGTIRANGDGVTETYSYWGAADFIYTTPSAAIALTGNDETSLTLSNAAGGMIEATGDLSTAVVATGAALTLDNAGTIRGGAGTTLGDADQFALWRGNPYLAGAIQTVGVAADRVTNSGTIVGSIDLGFGDDVIVNRGTIIGDVYLRDGDDSFTQLASAIVQGTVDGGAGTDSFIVDATGGGAVNADQFVNFERFSQIGTGNVSYSGNFGFDTIDLDGGRLVGLAGSTIRADSIWVRQGATFGSAGHVIGNINVAGTLSPGASPGTMTVTGNVALAGGSTTLMEISPTLSDQLLISGTLTIAQGAGLVLTADQQIRPGTTLDLIIANGGISGSYTSIVKSDSLFGFIVQDDKRIRLLGQFLNSGSFTPQLQRAIDYTNGVIGAGTAGDGLIDALPVLASASGASNSAAFARLTAEPYASATQMGVENGLTIANATRSIARLSGDDAPRAFSIGQYLGGLGRIAADDGAGLSASRSRSYGLLGGLGIGTDRWSIAGFGGYLDSRQTLRQLGSQTDADGWFVGVAGSYATGALRFDATMAYHQLDADTDRLTPDGGKAHGRYRLKNWVGDLSFSYEAVLGSDWAAQPDIGLTYVATTRTGVREDNGTVWALDVAKDEHDALFADGGIAFGRSRASDASFRPFVRLGVQYQLKGRGVEALGGFAGSNLNLLSLGARRGGLVGSVSGGAEMRVSSTLSLFANAAQTYSEDDRRASANIGMKFAF